MMVVLPQNNNDFFCHTCDIYIKIRNPSVSFILKINNIFK